MLKGLNQSELQEKVREKATELHELIEQIDEETEFEAYGTILYGIEEGSSVKAGGTQYGAAIDIAQVLLNSEELDTLQTAVVTLALSYAEEDDE